MNEIDQMAVDCPSSCDLSGQRPAAGAAAVVEIAEMERVEPDQSCLNQVDLHLNTAALDLHLTTRPGNTQLVELAARAEVLMSLLNQTSDKLLSSMQRIGYLEARLDDAQKQIEAQALAQTQARLVASRRSRKGKSGRSHHKC